MDATVTDAPAPAAASDTAPLTTPEPAQTATPAPQEGATSTTPPPAAPPEPRRYTLKVNGQPQEVDASVVDAFAKAAGMKPQDLLNLSQLHRAAYAKFDEAAKARQEAEALRTSLAKDPWAALKQAGLDPDALATARIQELIRQEQEQAQLANLPPHVQQAVMRARQIEEENARLRAEREQSVKAQETQRTQAMAQQFNAQLPQHMEAAGLPRTAEAARLVIEKAQAMVRAGIPVNFAAAAQAAASELADRNFALLRTMSPEAIIKAIGKQSYDALLKHSVEAVRGAKPQPPAQAPSQPQKPQRTAMTEREWRDAYER